MCVLFAVEGILEFFRVGNFRKFWKRKRGDDGV